MKLSKLNWTRLKFEAVKWTRWTHSALILNSNYPPLCYKSSPTNSQFIYYAHPPTCLYTHIHIVIFDLLTLLYILYKLCLLEISMCIVVLNSFFKDMVDTDCPILCIKYVKLSLHNRFFFTKFLIKLFC